jgi:hypothetical protein
MAVGGALRAAIRAGRFGAAGRESRRQARSLPSMNQGGGRQLPLEERGFERMGGMGYGSTPQGNAVIVDPATGRRTVLPQNFDDFMEGLPAGRRGPIEAPYEGVRSWNDPVGFGSQSFDAPPPWMGRGFSPPSRSFNAYSDGVSEYPIGGRMPEAFRSQGGENFRVFEPYSTFSMSTPPNQNFMNLQVPRAFGGQGSMGQAPPSAPLWARESMSPQELMEFMSPNAFAPRPRFYFDDFA